MRWLVVISALSLSANSVPIVLGQEASAVNDGARTAPKATAEDWPVRVTGDAPAASSADADAIRQQREQSRQWALDKLAALLPAEYDAYRKARSTNNQIDAARAAIQIVRKTRELEDPKKFFSAHEIAWGLCLRLLIDLKDKSAEELILDEWNRGFDREDGRLLTRQANATYGAFDRRLLTTHFWKALEESKKRSTACDVCWVLYLHGDGDDLNRLEEIASARRLDDDRSALVRNLIGCLQWRLSGHSGSDGPAPIFNEYAPGLEPVPPESP